MTSLHRPERTLRILASRERTAEVLRERTREQGVALALGLIDLRSFEDRLLRATELQPIGTTEARLAVSAVAPEAALGTTLAELAQLRERGEPVILLDARSERSYEASDQQLRGALRLHLQRVLD